MHARGRFPTWGLWRWLQLCGTQRPEPRKSPTLELETLKTEARSTEPSIADSLQHAGAPETLKPHDRRLEAQKF